MSEIDPGRIRHSNPVCVLRCAHPPGQPLRLWYYNGVLPNVPEDQDNDVVRSVRELLHYIYPEGGAE